MTPSERVRAVYHRQTPDYVPFTIYETKVKGRPYEKELMDLNICCIRRISSYRIVQEGEVNVALHRSELPGGHSALRSVTHTPFGDLTKTEESDEAPLPVHPEFNLEDIAVSWKGDTQ